MPAKHKPYRVRRSSAGLGLFAEIPFKKGQTIIEYIGRRISTKENADNKYIFNVNSRIDIDGSPRWNTARYVNHSCRPNCEAINRRGRIFIVAKRNIKPGEELTYHYGKDYFKSEYIQKMGCRCAKCQEERQAARKKN
ncbi:MAG: hypothetical protein A2808_04010 [Candidatus Moranbacteria bacterium RIFCSPHIGHO2_01_FULL_55_24]|nr:MAG: hypothetical protein A2808_04010 [Candidatus Moranbacteria bacterium RIFCSPHIGHO2_01_FULL_55_24]